MALALLIDGNNIERMVTVLALRRAGHEVLEAGACAPDAALAELKQRRVAATLPLAQQLRGVVHAGRRAVVRLDGRDAGKEVVERCELRTGGGRDG